MGTCQQRMQFYFNMASDDPIIVSLQTPPTTMTNGHACSMHVMYKLGEIEKLLFNVETNVVHACKALD